MKPVTIRLSGPLSQIVGGRTEVHVEAATLRGSLDALFRLHPELAIHLFDESGDLRRHVLCLHNGANARWSATLDVPVSPGDEIAILQAVSGG